MLFINIMFIKLIFHLISLRVLPLTRIFPTKESMSIITLPQMLIHILSIILIPHTQELFIKIVGIWIDKVHSILSKTDFTRALNTEWLCIQPVDQCLICHLALALISQSPSKAQHWLQIQNQDHYHQWSQTQQH